MKRVSATPGPEIKSPASGLPLVDSATVMMGRREVLIQHGDSTYRLRITASNKLILTK